MELVLDGLVPVAGRYRDQPARRLQVPPPALTCLEQARLRPTGAGRLSRRTAMTTGAVTKVVRRLETAGHVRRTPSGDHAQELLVELVPHEERDLLLDEVRDRVRASIRAVVATHGLRDLERARTAAGALAAIVDALGREAGRMEDVAARWERHARRRCARLAAGLPN